MLRDKYDGITLKGLSESLAGCSSFRIRCTNDSNPLTKMIRVESKN